MRIYKRKLYLSNLRGFYNDAGMIRILSGIRHVNIEQFMKDGERF